MREILFRGQTRRYGEKVLMGTGEKLPGRWVYGGVLQGTGDFSIIYGGEEPDFKGSDLAKWPVYTDTLGQYTGLTDKNGKRIFEGDIVRLPVDRWVTERKKGYYGYDDEGYPQKIPGFTGYGEYQRVVRAEGCFVVKFHPGSGFYADGTSYRLDGISTIVVGNIHDNPELMKEEPT